MSDNPQLQPPGWYYAQGDPPGTQRYWNGETWEGDPQPVPGAPQEVTGGPALAGAGARMGGRFIDWIIWAIISGIFQGIIIGGDAFSPTALEDVSYATTLIAGIVTTLVVVAYEVFLVSSRGGTLGKMVTGTKVVKPDGSPADMNTAVRRIAPYAVLAILAALLGPALGQLISLVMFVVGIASLVMLFSDSNKQTVWDKVAPSLVVRK